MPFDLGSVAPEARDPIMRTGQRFGSTDTLAQARRTLNALTTHGATLGPFGFVAAKTEQLRDLEGFLVTANVDREDARTARKVTNGALLDAERAGKNARFTARAGLSGARLALTLTGNTGLVRTIDATLAATARSGSDTDELATQLDQLRVTVLAADISPHLADATGLAATLTSRAAAIRAAGTAVEMPQGTPLETAQLDLIDGLIVALVRAARGAARAAARELAAPEIATAFELTALYQSARRPAPAPPVVG